jgi:uncharacterized protein (TIGR00255 family)
MTGFGDAACEADAVHYSVEIRSLNNRYFKLIIRMPDEIAALEPELDSLVRQKLTRGSITLNISMRSREASLGYEINRQMLSDYYQSLQSIRTERGAGEASIDLSSLLMLPGVIQPPVTGDLVDRCRPVIRRLTAEACDKLIVMRQREGQSLYEDLMAHRRTIAERLALVAERAPLVIEEYHQRLRNRIDDLLARAELKVGEVDLIKEVGVFAERSDISEETQRMSAHLDQFEQIMVRDGDEPAGRTLDFLAQELLREANTIASKSNDAQISRVIVEIKGAIDRIKEQVQNVE